MTAGPPPGGGRRILIAGGGSGGHLMPALAVARALRDLAPDLEPVLVGAIRGIEARLLPEREFRYHLLPSEPIYRRAWWRNARWPLIAARLLRRVRRLYAVERPVAVLGTGGYASAPVVWWGVRRGVPSAIQEQNGYPGLATRWLAHRVRQVYLGVPEARRFLRPGRNTFVFDTGNPITPPDPGRRSRALARFGLDGRRPVLLVTGGSQGALPINRAVAAWLAGEGRGEAAVLWVTGYATYGEFARFHSPPGVTVLDFLDPMADGYAVADLVVSRAGMNTVAELCAWGLPSVLVPLPTAAADHQRHNAEAVAAAGAAVLLAQRELPGGLEPALRRLLADPGERAAMALRARERGRPEAARTIASRLLTLLEPAVSFANSDNILL